MAATRGRVDKQLIKSTTPRSLVYTDLSNEQTYFAPPTGADYILKWDNGTSDFTWSLASAIIAEPATQVLFGTGTSVDSDSNFLYDSATNVMSVLGDGKIALNTSSPSATYDLHIKSVNGGVGAGKGAILINNEEDTDLAAVITIQAGLTAQYRRYMLFADLVGDGYQIGANEANDFILFSGYTGIHPILVDLGGQLQLNAANTQTVVFNNNPGAGTGGVEFYSGGAVPTKVASFDATNGGMAWFGLPWRARSETNSKYVEIKSSDAIGQINSDQKLRITSSELTVTGSNTLPYTYGTSGLILNHYQSLSSPFHFYSDLVANPSGQFSNSNMRFWTQETGAAAVERMIITNNGNIGIATSSPSTKLDINGGVRLRAGLYDGTNSLGTAGYILSSTGTATEWITPPTGDNIYNSDGTLDANRTVTGDDKTLIFTFDDTIDSTSNLTLNATNVSLGVQSSSLGTLSSFQAISNSIIFSAEDLGTGEQALTSYDTTSISTSLYGTTGVQSFTWDGVGGMIVQDSQLSQGMKYAASYAAYFATNPRSIPDVGYVNSLLSGMVSGSGTDNQFAYWNSGAITSTINARYDVANAVSVFAPTGFTVDSAYKLNAEAIYIRRTGPMLRLNTGSAADGRMEFQYNSVAKGGINIDSNVINYYVGFGNFMTMTGGVVGIRKTAPDTNASLDINGQGTSNSTYGLKVHDSTGANNALIVRDDGKVGFGTSSPTQPLDVVGNARLRAGLYDGSNSIGTSGYLLSSTGSLTSWVTPASVVAAGGGVTGTGVNTRVAYWSGTNTITGSSNYTYTDATKTLELGLGGTPATLKIENNTGGSRGLKIGSLEFGSYTTNNCWFGDNTYWAPGFVATNTGPSSLFYFINGGFIYRTAPSVSAGTSTAQTSVFAIKNDGNATFGGTLGNARVSVIGQGLSSSTVTAQFHNANQNNNALLIYDDGTLAIGALPLSNTRLRVNGTGSTPSTYTAQFHNSTGTNNGFLLRDDSRIGIGTATLNARVTIRPAASENPLYVQNSDGTALIYTDSSVGNVWINTSAAATGSSSEQLQVAGNVFTTGYIKASINDAFPIAIRPHSVNFFGTGVHGSAVVIGNTVAYLGVNKTAIGSIVPVNSLIFGGVAPGSIIALTDTSNQPLIGVSVVSSSISKAIFNAGYNGWGSGVGTVVNTIASNFVFNGALGTGTGTAGDIIFATGNVQASGTTGHTLTNRFYIQGNTGNLGAQVATPTAKLHIGAGTASASTAPLKFTTTSAALLTTPEAGAMEVLTTRIYYTDSTATRNTLAYLTDITGSTSIITDYFPVGTGTGITASTVFRDSTTLLTSTDAVRSIGILLNGMTSLTSGFIANTGLTSSSTFYPLSAQRGGTGAMVLRLDNGGTGSNLVWIKGNTTGDSYVLFNTGTSNDWSLGTDASASHTFKLRYGSDPSTGTTLLTASSGGNVGIRTDPHATQQIYLSGTLRVDLGSDGTGDVYYRNSGGAFTRLAAGTNGHVLTLAAGIPSWAAAPNGVATGVANQVAIYTSTSAIGSRSGSGIDSLYWDPINARLAIGTASAGSRLTVANDTSTTPYASFYGALSTSAAIISLDISRTAGSGSLDLIQTHSGTGNNCIVLQGNATGDTFITYGVSGPSVAYSHGVDASDSVIWKFGSGGTGSNPSTNTNLFWTASHTNNKIGLRTNPHATQDIYLLGTLRLDLGSDATGDIYYRDSGGAFTRLAAGTNGQVLTLASGIPSWATGGAGTVTGTGAAGQVSYWTGTSAQSGTNNHFWNDSTNRLGIGGTVTPVATLHIRSTGLGTTPTVSDGIYVSNDTAATSGNQQISPSFILQGNGWKTAATAASQSMAFRMFVTPVQGTTAPTSYLGLGSSVNGFYTDNQFVFTNAGQFAIGTTTPAVTSILDLTSTTLGMLVPRMTTTQKNAISSPANGLLLYDTTLNKLSIYESSAWKKLGDGIYNGSGSLSGNTTVTQAANTLIFSGTSGVDHSVEFSITPTTDTVNILTQDTSGSGTVTGELFIQPGFSSIGVGDDLIPGANSGYINFQTSSSSWLWGGHEIVMDGSGIMITDAVSTGLIYASDYSANILANNRSIPDIFTVRENNIENYVTVTSTTSPLNLSGLPQDFLITQGGTQSTFTFSLPASPVDGQICKLTFHNIVTTLTITAQGGISILGNAATTAIVGTQLEYKYYGPINVWIRVK